MTNVIAGYAIWPTGALEESRFTIVAVLSLALGVANTAILSIVNAVLLRSLPFPTPIF